MDMLKKVPVREQDPKVRATNFEEVCYGYNKEEAMMEAQRCFGCKNAKCIEGCPVSIDIPAFIGRVKVGEIEEAYKFFLGIHLFRLLVDVYARRRTSVKENVSAESKARLFPSVSWSVL